MKSCFARFLFQLMLFIFLVACSPGDRQAQPPTPQATVMNNPVAPNRTESAKKPTATVNWQIEFSMSGGFAGLRRTATLSNQGQLIAKDLKTNKQATIQISEKELQQISGWVMQMQPTLSTSPLSNCRDCFQYNITIQHGEQQISMQANDITLEATGMAPLINTLADLQKKALDGK